MNGTLFVVDHTALWIAALSLLIISVIKILFIPSFLPPYFAFSNVEALAYSSWRSHFAYLPKRLHQFSVFFLLLAFIDPHFLLPKDHKPSTYPPIRAEMPTEGIAIYLLLDQSGSMNENVVLNQGRNQSTLSKFDLLKDLTKQFILSRPSDLIGIVSFARIPKVVVPLTLDQDVLIDRLNELELVKDPADDGTAMGYAIFKTANLIAATRHFAEDLKEKEKTAYAIKHAIMIVVTDGFQDPSRLDYGNRLRTIELDEVATYAKEQGIRLYIVNIDPHFSSSVEFAPHRRQMVTLTEMTGGHFYSVSKSQDLQQVFETIDHVEKEEIPVNLSPEENLKFAYRRVSLFPYLILLGFICFLSALFLDTTFLKKIP